MARPKLVLAAAAVLLLTPAAEGARPDRQWPRVEVSVTGTFTLSEEGEELQDTFGTGCQRKVRWHATMTGSFASEKRTVVSLERLTQRAGFITLVGEARRSGEFFETQGLGCGNPQERSFDTSGCEGPWPLRITPRFLEIRFRPTLSLVGYTDWLDNPRCFFSGVPGAEVLALPLSFSELTVAQARARRVSVARGQAREVESLGPRFPDATGGATRTTTVSWQVRLVRR